MLSNRFIAMNCIQNKCLCACTNIYIYIYICVSTCAYMCIISCIIFFLCKCSWFCWCDLLRLSCRNCPHGLAWGRSTCHTGAGRTCLRSLTPLCSGCQVSPMTQASVLTWRELRSLASGQIPALPTQTDSSVRNQSVSLGFSFILSESLEISQ